jgi:hypothetical protein
MARARREYEGSLFAWHAAAVIGFMPFTGKQLNPGAINPFGTSDRAGELARVKAWVDRAMFAAWVREQFSKAGKV